MLAERINADLAPEDQPVGFSHVVSHEWERRTTIAAVHAGKISRAEVCDADFLLRAAAQHHGVDAGRACPICSSGLRLTLWIYGEALQRRSGSARRAHEIVEIAAQLRAQAEEFTVHAVEVCPVCRWNYLLETATAF